MEATNTMANRTLIIVLGVLATIALVALVAILKLYDGDKAIAIGALVTVVGLFLPGLLSLKQSTDARRQSEANGDAIQDVHTIVNSQRTHMEQQITTLRNEIVALRQDKIDTAREHHEAVS